jgi:hypothetical protein
MKKTKSKLTKAQKQELKVFKSWVKNAKGTN